MKTVSLALACLVLIGRPLPLPAADESAGGYARVPSDLKVVKEIVYKKAGGVTLDLMLFLPLEQKYERAPLVVYIHGGGWGGGDKFKVLVRDHIEVVRGLNRQGLACASIEYRLANGM